MGKFLRTLCDWQRVRLVKAKVCPDYVHMLVEIPPKITVSGLIGYRKGKSRIFCMSNPANKNTGTESLDVKDTIWNPLGKRKPIAA